MKNKFIGTGVKLAAALSIAVLIGACDKPTSKTPEVNDETRVQALETLNPYQKLLEQRLERGLGAGFAVSIIDDGQQDYLFAGVADKGLQSKIDKDSLFEIGSITKTFTTVVLADMVLKGELSLDDPADKYLPKSVTMPDDKGQKITLRDLATHTSSLPRMPSNFDPADPLNPYADYTPELMYDFLSGHKLERPIGDEIAYSNLGLGLLGHILELRSGQSYEALVRQRILEPLGMTSTFINVPDNLKFTTGHNGAGIPVKHWDIATLAGAGALRSSLEDMTVYLKANMGLIKTPLDEAIVLSHKIQIKEDANSSVGLGWFTTTRDGLTVTWHNGATGGFKSYLGFDASQKLGVIVLANAQSDTDLIARAILTRKPELLKPDTEDKNIEFTSEELDGFVGDYQLAPQFIISITRKDEQLFAQATGQSMFPIFPKSREEFFLKVVDASVIFKKDAAGKVTSLVLDQGGMMQPAPKIK